MSNTLAGVQCRPTAGPPGTREGVVFRVTVMGLLSWELKHALLHHWVWVTSICPSCHGRCVCVRSACDRPLIPSYTPLSLPPFRPIWCSLTNIKQPSSPHPHPLIQLVAHSAPPRRPYSQWGPRPGETQADHPSSVMWHWTSPQI